MHVPLNLLGEGGGDGGEGDVREGGCIQYDTP